jgi:hypothetical protein
MKLISHLTVALALASPVHGTESLITDHLFREFSLVDHQNIKRKFSQQLRPHDL